MTFHICSFYRASGSAFIGGKQWNWDFSEQFGPLFVRKDGTPIINQEVPKPVWKAFEDWYEKAIGTLPHREEQRAIQRGLADGTITIGRRIKRIER
jgi:hypothetical protein